MEISNLLQKSFHRVNKDLRLTERCSFMLEIISNSLSFPSLHYFSPLNSKQLIQVCLFDDGKIGFSFARLRVGVCSLACHQFASRDVSGLSGAAHQLNTISTKLPSLTATKTRAEDVLLPRAAAPWAATAHHVKLSALQDPVYTMNNTVSHHSLRKMLDLSLTVFINTN